MDTITLSKILTGLTLGFHIIFSTIGIGVPLFLLISEGLGILKKDPHYILLARRWGRGLAIIVAIGVVTGTVIGLLLTLLWPGFMRVAGHAISLPLFLETFAFFFEAIFLAIYLFAWDQLKPFRHWLLTIPITLGAYLSALFITSINAFMNSPAGFELHGGVLTNIHPLQAMFSLSAPSKVTHVLATSILTSAFILAAIAAYKILHGGHHIYYRKALRITMAIGILSGLMTIATGKTSVNFLANNQPEKLGEPIMIHYYYEIMIFIGIYLLLVCVLYFATLFKNKGQRKWLMRMIVYGGPLSMLAIELGWVFSEMGRQPWLIKGIMPTDAGVTTARGVEFIFILFVFLYFLLGTVCIGTLTRLFRNNTPEGEMEERGIC